jgi:hypothetical protein
MHATGGAWEPVSLHARAPVDLAPSNLEWTLRRGEPLLLAWNSVPADAGTELALNLTIDLHGTTPARLECIFADDGEGEVPADALEALIELGMTGFPAGTLARRSADHAALGAGGCLDFMATSSRLPSVTIEGYTPCNTDRDCPKGMDCNEMLQRCE